MGLFAMPNSKADPDSNVRAALANLNIYFEYRQKGDSEYDMSYTLTCAKLCLEEAIKQIRLKNTDNLIC